MKKSSQLFEKVDLEILKLQKRLIQIEKQLDKNRTSVIQDGWQTQRHAKKSRKWDFLAIEKMELIQKLELCKDNQ